MTATKLLLQRHQSAFPSLPVFPFYPFSSFSPTVSLGFRVDIPGFLVSLFRLFLSLSVGFSLFRFLSPFAAVLSSLFFLLAPPSFFCTRTVFIGAGGAGTTLPHPIAAHAWGARRLLCHGADSGGQWRRRLRDTAALASHHEMVASDFGSKPRGRKRQGEETRKKKTKLLFPCCMSRGRRRRNSAV